MMEILVCARGCSRLVFDASRTSLEALQDLPWKRKLGKKRKPGSLSPCSDLNVHLYVIGIVVMI